MKKKRLVAALGLTLALEQAQGAEFEKLGKAVQAILGTPKAVQKKIPVNAKYTAHVIYSKSAAGKPDKLAFIEKGIYEPNCTHTWAIGLDSAGKVTQIRVIEMSCPHAFPTKTESFLGQFTGKGPADVAKLDGEIQTVAKATGSSKLTTDAVKRAITTYAKHKGQL